MSLSVACRCSSSRDAEPAGCSIYFVVGDADELLDFHRANGVESSSRRATATTGCATTRCAISTATASLRPPDLQRRAAIEIERVDVPVRLEKRLAAALTDLAAHKRMSLTSCLEETLLHTFEPLGDGVASPHTKSQLRYIQELKKKHGIDYDSHASYRFVETGK